MDNDTILYRETVPIVWPFPSINGQQTDQSKALMLDKEAHKVIPFDLSTIEEALV